RQQRTEKKVGCRALYEYSGEVFDIIVAKQFGVLFDVDPHKSVLGPFFGQQGEIVVVFCASVTPLSAITGDNQAIVLLQPVLQRSTIERRIKNRHKDK